MNYALGIDVGTSYTAAATWRPDGRQQHKAEVVPLGNRAASVATVLLMSPDGSVLVGEAAERRALTDPDCVVREFKRRIGDDTPLFVGGRPHAAHDLAATMVRWVVDRVAEREGGPADRIAITHPAGWGPYKKNSLRTALRARGLDNLVFLSEPEAAAISYASLERVEAGTTIAVYDLGGGTFDAAVVRKTGEGSFTLLGTPDGLERLGGADFDEAVFAHVRDRLGAPMDELDIEDPSVLSGLARLRRECTEAKEALSADTEVSIPVLLPGITTQVRLVRSEFEEMIRPALEETVESLSRAISSAGVSSEELGAVLLVGGSSRVPLVAQMVSAELGCPVGVDADPKTTIALGAALSFAPQAASDDTTVAVLAPPAVDLQQQPTIDIPHQAPASHDQEPAGDHDQEFPTDPGQMPNRPQRPFSGWRSTEDETGTRQRKIAIGTLVGVTAVGLITGAILIPSALSSEPPFPDAQGRIPISEASAAEGTGDVVSGGGAVDVPGSTTKAKISAAGSLSFHGRGNTATANGKRAPGSPSPAAAAAAPVDNGAHGGRATTPAPPQTTTPGPAPLPPPAPTSNQAPPPPTTSEGPPPTTSEPPPPPPPTTSDPPPPPPTTSDPSPATTSDPPSATTEEALTPIGEPQADTAGMV